MATSIFERKRDFAYLVYFLIHIVVLFRMPQLLHPLFSLVPRPLP
jgi:hypothetical protein